MKLILSLGITVLLLVATLTAQNIELPGEAAQKAVKLSQTEVVDALWRLATQGQLLSPNGWHQACGFFTKPIPFTAKGVVHVIGNDWGPAYVLGTKDDTADVGLGYTPLGEIDSELRYSAPPKTDAVKTGILYHLVLVATYTLMYGSDGKTLVGKTPGAYRVWQIQGPPGPAWTTVNTAIRYVLEEKGKISDPVVRRNADETIAKLLKLH